MGHFNPSEGCLGSIGVCYARAMPKPAAFPEAIKVLLRPGTLKRIDSAAADRGMSRAAFLRDAIHGGIDWEDARRPRKLPQKEFPEQVFIPLPQGWKARIEKEAALERVNRSEWIRREMERAIRTDEATVA